MRIQLLASWCLIGLLLCVTWLSGDAKALVPLANPGFEDGVGQTAWHLGDPAPFLSPGNVPSILDSMIAGGTSVHSGRYSLELSFDSEFAWQLVDFPAPAGCALAVSAWVKMPTLGSPSTKVLSFDLLGMDDANQVVWGATSFPEFTGPYSDWTYISAPAYSPTQPTSRLVVVIHTQNGDGCGSICSMPLWVDDVSIDGCATPVEQSTWGRLKSMY